MRTFIAFVLAALTPAAYGFDLGMVVSRKTYNRHRSAAGLMTAEFSLSARLASPELL
jgi:hypothetical protein|tara:strand:+ start:211 stop:381 length:171 start_codon:yes stop_codon:yes gene_type:complete